MAITLSAGSRAIHPRFFASLARLALVLALGVSLPPLVGCESGTARARVVHFERSQYQDIHVVERDGRRCLQFSPTGSLQTCVDLHDPMSLALAYNRAMMVGLFVQPSPARVLMIGLGGGAIPRAFRALDPATQIDVVEIDPAVVRVATSHFGFSPDARMQVFVEDGRAFVDRQQRGGAHYDVVLLDAFDAHYIPGHLQTVEFLQGVRAILAPGGAVVANTFAHGPLREHEIATYRAVFAQVYTLPVAGSGNRIVLAVAAPAPALEMRATAQRLAGALGRFGVSAVSLVERLAAAPWTDAQPLTDATSRPGPARTGR